VKASYTRGFPFYDCGNLQDSFVAPDPRALSGVSASLSPIAETLGGASLYSTPQKGGRYHACTLPPEIRPPSVSAGLSDCGHGLSPTRQEQTLPGFRLLPGAAWLVAEPPQCNRSCETVHRILLYTRRQPGEGRQQTTG
jgi:hypothetical protein